MTARRLASVVVALIALFAPATAALAEASMADLIAMEKSLKYRTGDVPIGDKLATLRLGTDYRFLDAADARKVIVDGWGNPPGAADDVLGMIAPPKTSPLASDSWGVVITYVADGHVDDADAAKTDYAKLLAEMQKNTEAANDARVKAGYGAMRLVGWAQPPSYDAANKKLIWAKELAAGGPEHTLNYDVRVLGRRGVLSLNAVAGISDLPKLTVAMADVAEHAEFDAGERYADFNESAGDKMAAYGVAGLIAGGVATKAGLFKGILLAILALKKFAVILLIALVVGIKKLYDFATGRAAAKASPPAA